MALCIERQDNRFPQEGGVEFEKSFLTIPLQYKG